MSLLQPEMDTFMWEKATGLLQAVAMNPDYRSEIGAQSIEHLLRILQQVSSKHVRTRVRERAHARKRATPSFTHTCALPLTNLRPYTRTRRWPPAPSRLSRGAVAFHRTLPVRCAISR